MSGSEGWTKSSMFIATHPAKTSISCLRWPTKLIYKLQCNYKLKWLAH